MSDPVAIAVPPDTPRAKSVVQCVRLDGIVYLYRFICCGKCKNEFCQHGPYWYGRVTTGGVRREVYIGTKFMSLAEKMAAKKLKRERLHTV